jgi:hypothetical protein
MNDIEEMYKKRKVGKLPSFDSPITSAKSINQQ